MFCGITRVEREEGSTLLGLEDENGGQSDVGGRISTSTHTQGEELDLVADLAPEEHPHETDLIDTSPIAIDNVEMESQLSELGASSISELTMPTLHVLLERSADPNDIHDSTDEFY